MRLGVHLSIKNGFQGALSQALEIGCEGFQLFAGNPRGWSRKPLDQKDVLEFKQKRAKTEIWPVVVHLSYLPNPATEDKELYLKSVQSLAEDFERANILGADFFVFHPGKAKGINPEEATQKVADAVNLVLDKIEGQTLLLFENQSGSGNEIAASFQDLASILNKVHDSKRVGICFDTCHAFAAGYELHSAEGWEKTIDDLKKNLGMEFLKLFHLNDSMGGLGSHLDRHQHIGEGTIGLDGFRYLVNHPQLSQRPGILETPQNDPGDDLRNLSALRNLMKEVSYEKH